MSELGRKHGRFQMVMTTVSCGDPKYLQRFYKKKPNKNPLR